MADGASSKVDPYGFERDEDFDAKTYEEFMAKYLSVLARRASKWNEFVGKKSSLAKSGKLKRYCRKGIPSEHRPMIWMALSGAEESLEANQGLYRKLLQPPKAELLVDIINTDIPRTFPENIYFQNTPTDPMGKRGPLFNVLFALAMKNKEVGYCQVGVKNLKVASAQCEEMMEVKAVTSRPLPPPSLSIRHLKLLAQAQNRFIQGMNFVAGLLLLIVKEEEKVFWLMDTLMNKILPNYYSPSMAGIRADQKVLVELVKKKLPDVHQHMEAQGVSLEMVTTKWFICCYADVLPVETVLRIWDALFYEGSKVLFRVGVTLISIHKEHILTARTFPDIVTVFKKITEDKVALNCHDFVQNIFTVPGSFPQSSIASLRQTCMQSILDEQS